MSIQQNVNQLLFSAGYFAEPAMERARQTQAHKQLQKATDIGAEFEKQGGVIPATVHRDVAQAWYGLGKEQFAKKPNQQTFADYVKAAGDAEKAQAATMRWQTEAQRKIDENELREAFYKQGVLGMEEEEPPRGAVFDMPTESREILKTGGNN